MSTRHHPTPLRPRRADILSDVGAMLSADIGFWPPAAMNECPLTAIGPLSVVGERTLVSAVYRH